MIPSKVGKSKGAAPAELESPTSNSAPANKPKQGEIVLDRMLKE